MSLWMSSTCWLLNTPNISTQQSTDFTKLTNLPEQLIRVTFLPSKVHFSNADLHNAAYWPVQPFFSPANWSKCTLSNALVHCWHNFLSTAHGINSVSVTFSPHLLTTLLLSLPLADLISYWQFTSSHTTTSTDHFLWPVFHVCLILLTPDYRLDSAVCCHTNK